MLMRSWFLLEKKTFFVYYTRAQNVSPGWPVYEVKCLCSRAKPWISVYGTVPEGGDEGERVTTPTNISVFDFCDVNIL